MDRICQAVILAISAVTLVPALAEGPANAPHAVATLARACLDHKDRDAANESGKVIHLAAAIRAAKKRMPGTVVRARLCQGKHGLVYVLTVLARNGKVARLTVDAGKGTLAGNR